MFHMKSVYVYIAFIKFHMSGFSDASVIITAKQMEIQLLISGCRHIILHSTQTQSQSVSNKTQYHTKL
jgi:hypothetical protein